MNGLILRFLNLTESNVGVRLNFYVQPRCSLCSKFASSCFCKNVSRKGAKEQREKRIALTLSLLLCAFAGNVWLWLCCSVSPRLMSDKPSQRHCTEKKQILGLSILCSPDPIASSKVLSRSQGTGISENYPTSQVGWLCVRLCGSHAHRIQLYVTLEREHSPP